MKYKYFLCNFLLTVIIILTAITINAQIDSGYVDTKDGQIFYRIWGNGEPLVFLNGGPGFSSQGYESYAEQLSKYRKVILFDQRGTGKSTLKNENKRISIDKMVSDLEQVRTHLKIEKWDVLGHSFGGQYALHYLSKHSENINKLILSASPAYNVDFSTQSQKFKNIDYTSVVYLLELGYFKKLRMELEKENPSRESILRARRCALARYYVCKEENYFKVADWFANKSNSSEYVSRKVRNSCNANKISPKKLKKFTKPVLIVHGASDFLNISNPLTNHKLFPNSKLEIIYDSGHIMSIDQKEKYYDLIANFLVKGLEKKRPNIKA